MPYSLAASISLAWVAVVPLLFRLLGPRTGLVVAFVGGYLFLPNTNDFPVVVPSRGLLPIDRTTVTGLGVLLGVLLVDRKAVARFRPHAADLPMLAYLLLTPVSYLASDRSNWVEFVNQLWTRLTAFAVPYLAGRIYLGHREGVQKLSYAVVLGGLAYIPLCLFETIAGPKYYLNYLLYREVPHLHMVFRLGGNRPEVFLPNGIEVAAWMAMATVVSVWICVSRDGLRLWRVPGWVVPVALLATTAACRGVFGYVTLAVGLAATGLMQLIRSRVPLVLLLLVPPAYMTARLGGFWDGRQLVEVAGRADKAATMEYRLRAETEYMDKVKGHNLALGFGAEGSAIYDFWAKSHLFPDGIWIHVLREGGVAALAAFYAAVFLGPAGLAAVGLPSRTLRGSSVTPAWGLALFLAMHANDTLLNFERFGVTPLIGGSVVGLVLVGWGSTDPGSSRRSSTGKGRSQPQDRTPEGPRAPGPKSDGRKPLPDPVRVAVVLAALAAPEVVGAVTGSWPYGPARPPRPEPKFGPLRAPKLDQAVPPGLEGGGGRNPGQGPEGADVPVPVPGRKASILPIRRGNSTGLLS